MEQKKITSRIGNNMVQQENTVVAETIAGGEDHVLQVDDLLKNLNQKMERAELDTQSSMKSNGTITIREVKFDDSRKEDMDMDYDPKMVSIGLFNWSRAKQEKPRLAPMQKTKLEYLKNLVRRSSENKEPSKDYLRDYLQVASHLHDDAKSRYSGNHPEISITREEFVEMLVLDGCFILELLFKYRDKNTSPGDIDRHHFALLRHDLLLFENQIPFFVLEKLLDATPQPPPNFKLAKTAYKYLTQDWKYTKFNESDEKPKYDHLLHLIYMTLCITPDKFSRFRTDRFCKETMMIPLAHMAWPLYGMAQLCSSSKKEKPWDRQVAERLPCATELEEEGLSFKTDPWMQSFVQVTVRDGIVWMPYIDMDRDIFSLLKNLIAWEVYNPKDNGNGVEFPVTQFARFLCRIIRSNTDVKILETSRVISTGTGRKETLDLVAELSVVANYRRDLEYTKYFEEHVVDEINNFFNHPYHRWRTKLVKEYFTSPWSIIGLLVGFVVVVLTAVQTIYTVLSY